MLEESPARGRARRQTSEHEESRGMRRAHEDTVSVQKNPMDSRRRAQREQTTAKSRDLSRDDLLFLSDAGRRSAGRVKIKITIFL